MSVNGDGYYILSISIHGLLRGNDMELGADADTGGQIRYVVELARALGARPEVARVDLLTRLVTDPKVGADYARPEEAIGDGARIVRIPFGPRRYLRKEKLWPYLDVLVDHTFRYLRSGGRTPDLIHAHYADAGYVGARLSSLLDVPMIFTGHSLGRTKRQRLLDDGADIADIEHQYRLGARIEAEEQALQNASFIIASTQQEVEEQYRMYDHYDPRRMLVIPPGVDLSLYAGSAAERRPDAPAIQTEIFRFLDDPKKPMILAMARPDRKKNIAALIRAYAEHPTLKRTANLVIVAGSRDDIRVMDKGAREVLTELLVLVDVYNLYGHVAYPKRHESDDVPHIYRMAAKSRGVFVNPALVEPFGLTLLEAAAAGLPVVATNDGGPTDIVAECKNGFLVNPMDERAIGEAIADALADPERWSRWAKNGRAGTKRRYSWDSHVTSYLRAAKKVIRHDRRVMGNTLKKRLVTHSRMVVTDIDGTLVGDREGIDRLRETLLQGGGAVGFGVTTGRSLASAVAVLRQWDVPTPNVLFVSSGSEIYYGPNMVKDLGYTHHINHRWPPDKVREILADIPGLTQQPPEHQGEHKISYYYDDRKAPRIRELIRILRRHRLGVNVIPAHGMYLDILPMRASKGSAIRYFADKWDIPLERFLVAGESGNDAEMLVGANLGAVVGNHHPDLDILMDRPGVYFARGHCAHGVVEAIEHFNFFRNSSSDRNGKELI
jgi:sucrose-phosphate synthase